MNWTGNKFEGRENGVLLKKNLLLRSSNNYI